MWQGVIDVEEDVMSLFQRYIDPTLSQANTSVYDPPCHNNCSTNLLGRSFFYSLFTIYYVQLHTPSMWQGVIDVEKDVMSSLFPS